MSDYFCVFTKNGFLLHEKGILPKYRDTLIESLNTQKKYQTRAIQDSYMFCNFNNNIVYLAVLTHRNEDLFKKMIVEYHKSLNNLEDNEAENDFGNECESKDLKVNVSTKSGSKGKPKNLAQGKERSTKSLVKERKWDNIEEDPSLDFSSQMRCEVTRNETQKNAIKKSYRFNLFSKLINKEELKEKMETHLINKNLSVEVAKELINNVLEEMPDKINENDFKIKIKEVIGKLIKSLDHELLIKNIKKKHGIFVFCFVGVNGVGKSTTLAKMCCWLLKHNLKVYIAACDTFRAGAVEQLKVHVDAFKKGGYNVGFYEKGYNKDDANVAKNAIRLAEDEGYDVILIDTAGRMHNKKNLMESLSKLIRVNPIDHIIFVGEALVGNDSLEHLKEFNKAITFGNAGKCIDSIFVSKVDTVDDKIGQVVNMSVSGECPILFLGTGQTNSSLMTLKPDFIVDLLMN